MQIKDVGVVIATRRYFLMGKQDNQPEVVVKIGMPQPFSNSADFFCPVQLTVRGINKLSYGAGVDEVQALRLALKLIAAELEILNCEYQKKLRWIGDENGDLGFPRTE